MVCWTRQAWSVTTSRCNDHPKAPARRMGTNSGKAGTLVEAGVASVPASVPALVAPGGNDLTFRWVSGLHLTPRHAAATRRFLGWHCQGLTSLFALRCRNRARHEVRVPLIVMEVAQVGLAPEVSLTSRATPVAK